MTEPTTTDTAPATEPAPAPPPPNAPAPLTAEDFKTEQEKDTATGGVGPAEKSKGSPGPVETMEDLGIGPRTPYPTGGEAAAAEPGEPPVDAPATEPAPSPTEPAA